LTFDEVKTRFLGKTSEPEVFEVEKGSAKRYAVAVDDLNPLYLDEDAARASKYGAVLAPPGFFGWPVKQPAPPFPPLMTYVMKALAEAGFTDIMDGGTDYDFVTPIRAGDIIICSRTLSDLLSRGMPEGRKMAFFVIESEYTNQNGQLACKTRQTIIAFSRAA
jgi:acyl dehydratase